MLLKERSIGQEDGSGYWMITRKRESARRGSARLHCLEHLLQHKLHNNNNNNNNNKCFVECETVIARSLVNLCLLTAMNKTFGLGT